MGLTTLFANLTAATGQELDTNFAEVGAQGTLQCSAVGTNAIVLTPVANQSAVAAYGAGNPQKFGFTAAATSTGAVTLEILSLGFFPVYTPNGVQATTNTLASGTYYEVTYTIGTSYNSGNGAWVLSSYVPPTGTTPVTNSSVSGFKMTNNAVTPNTKIDLSFTQACLVTAVGSPAFLGILAATIDLTTGTVTSTANGMDGESRPASGWVYVYAISTGTGMAGLGTTVSPLSGPPTLPAGYTFYAFVGAMFCNGSSNLLRTRQLGIDTQYTPVAASTTVVLPNMANGVAGTASTTAPVFAAIAVGLFVPPTASDIRIVVTNQYGASGGVSVGVAPNASYAGVASTNPGLFYIGVGIALAGSEQITFLLESTNIYWFSGGTGGGVNCMGWSDYVSAAA